MPAAAPPRGQDAVDRDRRRDDQQPQERRRARFPLSALVCVTGVSGSGKSSLVNETLARALARRLGGSGAQAGPASPACAASARSTSWSRSISRRSAARRAAIRPRTPACSTKSARCSPAPARPGSAATRPAASASTSKGAAARSARGRACGKIEMNFLPDLYVTCPVCEGQRFNRQTLEVRYRGRSIADVLDMRVDEAVEFFENFPQIARLLAQPAGSRAGLPDARAVVDHALRRRGPAHQAGHRTGPRRHRQDALHPRRADHRPALRRHPQAAGRAAAGWSTWATR